MSAKLSEDERENPKTKSFFIKVPVPHNVSEAAGK